MRVLGVCLLSISLLLSARTSGAEDVPVKRKLFAPGTGTTCASFCSQRWYDHPPSARACINECNARTLTATAYFRGGMRGDRLDCNELLVSPSGRGRCASHGGRLASDYELGFPSP
jgi:hypothetical protein